MMYDLMRFIRDEFHVRLKELSLHRENRIRGRSEVGINPDLYRRIMNKKSLERLTIPQTAFLTYSIPNSVAMEVFSGHALCRLNTNKQTEYYCT